MVKAVIISTLVLIASLGQAQTNTESRTGLLRSGLGLKLGNSAALSSFYGSGDLEYYIDHRVSIEGETNYYLGSLKDSMNYNVLNNHSLLAGANYHFSKRSGFDPYTGFKVGVGFTEMDPLNHEPGAPCYEELQIDPIVAVQLGFNYFTDKYFHMFMEGGYVFQTHNTAANPGLKLNEISFKFGLGIHVDWFRTKSHRIPNISD